MMRRFPQRLSAIAGPASLMLLPKCPLCFASILAGAGVVVPGALGLSLATGLLLAPWAALLMALTGGRAVLRGTTMLAVTMSVVAIAAQVRPLLWAGVLSMTAVGIGAARSCAAKPRHSCGVAPVSG
jgi:hypothetical protein